MATAFKLHHHAKCINVSLDGTFEPGNVRTSSATFFLSLSLRRYLVSLSRSRAKRSNDS